VLTRSDNHRSDSRRGAPHLRLDESHVRTESGPADLPAPRGAAGALDLEELRRRSDDLASPTERVVSDEPRYRELIELAPDAYLVTDAGANVVEANRAAATLLHIPRAFLAGKPLAVFVDPDARRALRDRVGPQAAPEPV
jgi:PAS domain-containing protein